MAGRGRCVCGLCELRPGDGEALNNLGFCLLPTEVEEGLLKLQQASLYSRSRTVVNAANTALALHLLGRDVAALAVGEECLATAPQDMTPAFLWRHLQTRKLTREEVAAAYWIPPPMVGILDYANFSNVTEFHKMLYADALGPWFTLQGGHWSSPSTSILSSISASCWIM